MRQHGAGGRIRPVGARHSSNTQICVEAAEDRAIRVTSPTLDPDYRPVRVSARVGADGTPVHIADVDASLTLEALNDLLSAEEPGDTLGFGSVFFAGSPSPGRSPPAPMASAASTP